MKEGGESQISSVTGESQKGSKGKSVKKSVHFDKADKKTSDKTQQQDQTATMANMNSGMQQIPITANSLEVLNAAASNMKQRVHHVEEKIREIRKSIAGHNGVIKKHVSDEKHIWMQSFE